MYPFIDIDLYLIHQPATYDHANKNLDMEGRVEKTWKGMEAIYGSF